MGRGLVLAALIGLVVGLWTWTRPGQGESHAGGPTTAVHVLDNGFHTDLAIPREALEARGGPLAQAVARTGPGDWVLVGWGDAVFYVDTSPMQGRLADGARAFLRPGNPSVVMLHPVRGDPSRRFAPDRRRTVSLGPQAFDRLAGRIEASLDLTGGRARVQTARASDGAWFFHSRETFSVAYLCNHWTARVLNAAGLAIRPLRSVTSGEVMATIDRAMDTDRPAA